MKKKWLALLILLSGGIISGISYFQWDIQMAYAYRGLDRQFLDIAQIITSAGDSKWYFLALAAAFFLFSFILKSKNWSRKILFLALVLSASGLLNMLLKWICGRSRPINLFLHGIYGFHFFALGYEWNSFPSGHSATVFSLATALSILSPRFGFLAFIPATVVASSRVLITSHYLSDVIAGACVGIIGALLVKYYFGALSKKKKLLKQGIKN